MNPETVIAEVHASDVATAQVLMKHAIAKARDQWIPADAIVDALIQELISFAAKSGSPARASAYLRAAATLIERSSAPLRSN
jgi:hypothetical protein